MVITVHPERERERDTNIKLNMHTLAERRTDIVYTNTSTS